MHIAVITHLSCYEFRNNYRIKTSPFIKNTQQFVHIETLSCREILTEV